MSRRTSRLEINMFPFLSVLCALIGVLSLFLLLILSSRIVGEDVGSHDQPGTENRSAQPAQAELDDLARRLDIVRASLAARHQEYQELLDARRRLWELLAAKQAEAEDLQGGKLLSGVALSEHVPVVMEALDHTASSKQPVFIEVDLQGFLVHPRGEKFLVSELPSSDPTAPSRPKSALERYLDAVDQQRERQFLCFLIRPSGSAAFDSIRSFLTSRYPHPSDPRLSRIDMGWEPFAAEWLLLSEDQTPATQ